MNSKNITIFKTRLIDDVISKMCWFFSVQTLLITWLNFYKVIGNPILWNTNYFPILISIFKTHCDYLRSIFWWCYEILGFVRNYLHSYKSLPLSYSLLRQYKHFINFHRPCHANEFHIWSLFVHQKRNFFSSTTARCLNLNE